MSKAAYTLLETRYSHGAIAVRLSAHGKDAEGKLFDADHFISMYLYEDRSVDKTALMRLALESLADAIQRRIGERAVMISSMIRSYVGSYDEECADRERASSPTLTDTVTDNGDGTYTHADTD